MGGLRWNAVRISKYPNVNALSSPPSKANQAGVATMQPFRPRVSNMLQTDQIAPVVRLACQGWEHAAWVGSFYPEEMPPEWRLAYFNTQFHGVFLPRVVWQALGDEQWRAWRNECHDQFVFLLEAEPGDTSPRVDVTLLSLDSDKRVLWFDRTTDLKSLGVQLRAMDAGAVLWLISRDADLGQIERVRTLLELLGLAA